MSYQNKDTKNEEDELIEKLVSINRVAKVVKGGRRFGFAALVVVGDGKGRVGIGANKAREVPEAIRKASVHARKKLLRVPLREGRTLHHDILGKFGKGLVLMRSAPPGTGIIAGGPVRAVFEALGVSDVVVKSIGSSNPHNMIKAALDGLLRSSSPRLIAQRRGKKVSDIIRERNLKHGGKEVAKREIEEGTQGERVAQAESSQEKSSQAESSQEKSSQAESSQEKSSQETSSEVAK